MSVKLEIEAPGVWVNSNWKGDLAQGGTFALLIGVSRYENLGNGSAVSNMLKLGQLAVSANTASKLFSFLTEQFHSDEAPLAKVWLLISPQQDELDEITDDSIKTNLLTPTYDNCSTAIWQWFTTMQQLDDSSAAKSKALFFFSGHGLEVTQDEQILLPSDYLNPKMPDLNRALNSSGIRKGLSDVAIPSQFFFFDACRSDHWSLHEQEIKGYPILPQKLVGTGRRPAAPAIYYASTSGEQAYQPVKLEKDWDASLFGMACLDGLLAREGCGIEIDQSTERPTIRARQLGNFLGPRIDALLRAKNSKKEQEIVTMVGSRNPAITELLTPVKSETPIIEEISKPLTLKALAASTHKPLGEAFKVDVWDLNNMVARSVAAESAELINSVREKEKETEKGKADTELPVITNLHTVLGSERMTGLATSLRLYRISRKEWLDTGEGYELKSVERDPDLANYRIVVKITDDRGPHLASLNYGDQEFTLALPTNRPHANAEQPNFLLQIKRARHGGASRITRLRLSLALDNVGLLKDAASLWFKYRQGDVEAALESLGKQEAVSLLSSKTSSPLAAEVAAIILLRSDNFQMLGSTSKLERPPVWIEKNWLRNLAGLRDSHTDARVIWLEQLFRQGGDDGEVLDAVRRLLMLDDWSLPFTYDAMALLKLQLETMLSPDVHSLGSVRAPAKSLLRHVSTAVRYLQPGGLFCVYSTAMDPIMLQGS